MARAGLRRETADCDKMTCTIVDQTDLVSWRPSRLIAVAAGTEELLEICTSWKAMNSDVIRVGAQSVSKARGFDCQLVLAVPASQGCGRG